MTEKKIIKSSCFPQIHKTSKVCNKVLYESKFIFLGNNVEPSQRLICHMFTLPPLQNALTIVNGLFQAKIHSNLYPSTTLTQFDNGNGLFWPIKVLKCDHMTQIDQSACSNCNNGQKDQNNDQYIKSKMCPKVHKNISDINQIVLLNDVICPQFNMIPNSSAYITQFQENGMPDRY